MTGRQPESQKVYERLKKKFGGFSTRSNNNQPTGDDVAFGPGRDPGSFAEAMGALTNQMGWSTDLARADLMHQWEEIVGSDIAAHTIPAGVSEGVLEIHCDSSAWATQLRLMRGELVENLAHRFPEATIVELSIKAPGVPSWKHGRRSVPGRGPRDTYG
jgi:predicted nucleic acid-binding Zn ribbon protein